MKKNANTGNESLIAQNLSIISKFSWNYIYAHVKNKDLTGVTYNIIGYISQNPQCSQDDVSKSLDIDKSSVAKIVNKLVINDFVKRIRNDADRREYKLTLSTKGKAIARDLQNVTLTWQKLVTENISESDMETFNRVSEIINEKAKELK
ncbi:MAG: MarR family winged helix-turn-helix transcriptional regulator [Solobacterium sp.]|nr:MarR family winged helix-turn-helix transcriptional regulator [Solobacterium sp.]